MTYLLKIENTSEGKSLIDFLKSLKFVELIDNSEEVVDEFAIVDENGIVISEKEIDDFLIASESSVSIKIDDAFKMSELWKNN